MADARKPPREPLARLRERKSYAFFGRAYDFFEARPTPEEALRFVFRLLDEKGAFRSRRNSGAARESMEQVVRDRKMRSARADALLELVTRNRLWFEDQLSMGGGDAPSSERRLLQGILRLVPEED